MNNIVISLSTIRYRCGTWMFDVFQSSSQSITYGAFYPLLVLRKRKLCSWTNNIYRQGISHCDTIATRCLLKTIWPKEQQLDLRTSGTNVLGDIWCMKEGSFLFEISKRDSEWSFYAKKVVVFISFMPRIWHRTTQRRFQIRNYDGTVVRDCKRQKTNLVESFSSWRKLELPQNQPGQKLSICNTNKSVTPWLFDQYCLQIDLS